MMKQKESSKMAGAGVNKRSAVCVSPPLLPITHRYIKHGKGGGQRGTADMREGAVSKRIDRRGSISAILGIAGEHLAIYCMYSSYRTWRFDCSIARVFSQEGTVKG